MKNKKIKVIGATVLSLILTGVVAPTAFTEPAAPALTASVVSQQCQGGNGVNVSLTGVLSPDKRGVLYAWDLNNDGIFETVPDANPTVTAFYPDESVVTASVAVMKNGRTKLTDSITFETCTLSLSRQRFVKGGRRTWCLRSPLPKNPLVIDRINLVVAMLRWGRVATRNRMTGLLGSGRLRGVWRAECLIFTWLVRHPAG